MRFLQTLQLRLDQSKLGMQKGQFRKAKEECERLIQEIQLAQSQMRQLVQAITHSNHTLLKDLLESPTLQANLNQVFQSHPLSSSCSGLTFLQIAIQAHNEWAVWQLLERGADPNFTGHGQTPLAMAMNLPASEMQLSLCNLLVMSGATLSDSLRRQAKSMHDKSLYVIMQNRLLREPEFPEDLIEDFPDLRHDLWGKISRSEVSNYRTVSSFSSPGIASTIEDQCDLKKIEETFQDLFDKDKVRPILEIMQLATIGLSYLKEAFKGFYITNEKVMPFFFEEKCHWGPHHRNFYINLNYKQKSFNLVHCVKQATVFAIKEIYQNPDHLPFHPWDEEKKAAFHKSCYSLRLHPKHPKERNAGIEKLFLEQRWADLLPTVSQILVQNGGQAFLQNNHPELMAFYDQFLEDCNQHSRYLRFKHGLWSMEMAAAINQENNAFPSSAAAAYESTSPPSQAVEIGSNFLDLDTVLKQVQTFFKKIKSCNEFTLIQCLAAEYEQILASASDSSSAHKSPLPKMLDRNDSLDALKNKAEDIQTASVIIETKAEKLNSCCKF